VCTTLAPCLAVLLVGECSSSLALHKGEGKGEEGTKGVGRMPP
jgi:hypothetical protein